MRFKAVFATAVLACALPSAAYAGGHPIGSPFDRPGFFTAIVDGRLWVFRKDDRKSIDEFQTQGEPAKSVSRIGAGPNRMTIRAPDAETLDAYLKAPASPVRR